MKEEKLARVFLESLPFKAQTFEEFEKQNKNLQKFISKLEKKFGETIWYIGMDYFGGEIYERFTFKKGGFMEVRIGKTSLEAFFDSKEKAEKFKNALIKTLQKFSKINYKIKIKEEFINLKDLFKVKRLRR